MSVSFTTAEKQLYNGLSGFAQDALIDLNQFWNSERLCVPVSEFKEMMEVIGYTPSNSQVSALQKQGPEFISIENVLEGVEYWKTKEESIALFLSKKSPKKQKQYEEIEDHDGDGASEVFGINKAIKANNRFLKQHSKKQINDKIQLQKTLNKVKNQSEYEITVKVGETNDICKKLKNGMSYMLDTQGGQLQILEQGKNGSETLVSVKNFERRYENFKRAAMNLVDEQEDLDMQEDLKKVLVQVMCLSSEMKKQLKMLEQKGISPA